MNKKLIIIALILILFFSIILFNQYSTPKNKENYSNWKYDKNEYPKSEYKLDELPVSHKSAYEVRQFFEDSDTNHDDILKEEEINTFDYKIKHSQYTFNGPYGYN